MNIEKALNYVSLIMKFFDSVAEVVGWIKIMIALLAVGVVLGWITYYNVPNTFGMILGIFIALIGLLSGLYFANKAWRSKHGTVFTATRHMHSPDVDKQGKKELKRKK